jgi:hypothetical protein
MAALPEGLMLLPHLSENKLDSLMASKLDCPLGKGYWETRLAAEEISMIETKVF